MGRIIGDATALVHRLGLARTAARRAAWIALLVVVACAAPTGIDVPRASGGGANSSTGGQPGEPAMGEAGETGSSDPGPTWCEALGVIQHKCQRCHHEPPGHGAPFALVSYDDTQSIDGRGVPRFERMRGAIESDFMPATFLDLDPPVEPLDASEKALLLDWLTRGARAVGGTRCSADEP